MWRRKANVSAQIRWGESNITYSLEDEGERWICQHRWDGENQPSHTFWKVKKKGDFISTDQMERIRHHLLSGRWRRKAALSAQIRQGESDITYKLKGEEQRWVHQHRSDGENQPSHTFWKVKKKGDFISTDQMERIRHHLLSGRWRGKVNSSTRIRWEKSDMTYSLKDEGERWIHQHRSGENQPSLTCWKVKGKGEFISTDQIERVSHCLLAGRWILQHRSDGENQTSLTRWKVMRKGEFFSTDQMGRISHYLLAGRSIHQHRSDEESHTSLTSWKVENKGDFFSTDKMERIRHHLLAGRWREGWILQHRWDGENQTSLTSWNAKETSEFISTGQMGRIRHHLLPVRWRKVNWSTQVKWRESTITYLLEGEDERWIHQHRSDGENQPLLTSWKVKEKGELVSTNQMERIGCHLHTGRWRRKVNSLKQIRQGELDMTYKLEDEEERWVHQHRSVGRISQYLLAGRWRWKVTSSAQIRWGESAITYSLKGEGRQLHQHRSDEENQPWLTLWKVKEKGNFFSTDQMGRISHYLLAGRWRTKVIPSAQMRWGKSDITYSLEGEGERSILQCRWDEENQTSLTSWKVKGEGGFISTDEMGRIRHHLLPGRCRREMNWSAQIRWGESIITYKLEGEGERWIGQHRSNEENQPSLTCWKVKKKGEFISTDQMGRINHHLRAGRWRWKLNSSAQIRWGESIITYKLEDEEERLICQHRWDGENQTSLTC